MTRPIFLLTDFGLTDPYVGIVKAVILGILPTACLVDLTHDIPPQEIRAGAYALLTAAPYLPTDAIVLAVVDPGVGTDRRPVAAQVDGRTFIGPDNGLLSWALATLSAAASPSEGEPTAIRAVVLDHPEVWLPNVSATFHGRDIFAPVAAHLAAGLPLSTVGTPTDTLTSLVLPGVERETDAHGSVLAARGEVIHVDRYGNLITNIAAADVPANPVTTLADYQIRGLAAHYQGGDGPLLALVGSSGFLELSAPNGSAATLTGAGVGATVVTTSASAA
jgi:S-adenosylmethionine hydrolase